MATQYDVFRGGNRKATRRDATQTARLAEVLGGYSVSRLGGFFHALTGEVRVPAPKARLVEVLAQRFDIQTAEEYAAFCSRLPSHVVAAVERGIFDEWIRVAELEKLYGGPILYVEERRGWYPMRAVRLQPDARLEFFECDRQGANLRLEGWMRERFLPFVEKPRAWVPAPRAGPSGETWAADDVVSVSLPLLRAALKSHYEGMSRLDIARKGLKKTDIAKLRAVSGMPPFPRARAYGLDSIELLARFWRSLISGTRPKQSSAKPTAVPMGSER